MNEVQETDVVLIGAGIMSATLGTMLRQLQPDITIEVFERLDSAAAESSDAWNNAGTGHSAFCELNYTPEKPDGSIDISKALKIAESFEVSKQFWAYLIEKQLIEPNTSFINAMPHMSFVWGHDNVAYLRRRYEALCANHLFRDMQYTEDPERIAEWTPLIMQRRDRSQRVAATRMDAGTDVNFGSLTRCMFNALEKTKGVELHFHQNVRSLRKKKGRWRIVVENLATGKRRKISAGFVFIGAGGGSLPLLLKSRIPEARGFGGFPVSGQWLKCNNEEVIRAHNAKVYGKAPVGSPPMSVPHLDTRWIKNRQELLFGPYAGFTTKFLKKGSMLDLFKSIKLSNIRAMLFAGLHNIPLTRYLIEQVRQSSGDRLEALREFYPAAKTDDWELAVAGYRVQVIKKDEKEGGILEFGTEVVKAADGTLAALLGASPGASTATSIMINLIESCFPDKIKTDAWQARMKCMVPSWPESLAKNETLAMNARRHSSRILNLQL